jgi:tetratricopeptide (TPR) repeat protein
LFERLCDHYRERKDWNALAALLADTAGRTADPAVAVGLLREAAGLQRDNLANPPRGLELLRQARQLAPRNLELLRDVLQSLTGIGERAAAMSEIVAALATDVDPMSRAELLCLRADMHEASGDFPSAVADLDQAHGDLIQSWSGDGDDVSGIRSMTEAFVERRRYAPPWRQSRTPRAS